MVPIISTAKETFTGTIVGYTSLIHQSNVPIDNRDPHIELEKDFVLLVPNGDHYLMPNISRGIKPSFFLCRPKNYISFSPAFTDF